MARKARDAKSTFEIQEELDDCPPIDQPTEVRPEGPAEESQSPGGSFLKPRHQIDIGNGHKIHFIRNQRFLQNAISLESPEGKNIRPDSDDFEWLESRGWKWREQELLFTKQLDRNTDSQRYARANSDRFAQDEFVELGNLIRQRNGMAPIDYEFAEGRGGGR